MINEIVSKLKTKFKFFAKLKNVSKYRLVFLIIFLLVLITNLSTYFITYGEFVSRFEENASGGITGVGEDTVIIDDLESDWNYYEGLNYTSSDGVLPTGNDLGLYDDSNLVQTKIIYDGTDLNSNLRGYVSPEEMQYVFVYYKTYPVLDNGTSDTSDDYIEFELIDNPYTKRPSGKAFNGWITNYRGAEVSLDNDRYVRSVKVPVTYSGGNPDTINITFNASWTDAESSTVSSSRNWQTAFSSLDSAGMKEVVMREHIVEYAPYDMTGYFYRVTIARNQSYAGYYNANGVLQTRGTCRTNGGCTYYDIIDGEDYDSSNTYYHLVNGTMAELDPSTLDFQIIRDEYVDNENINGGVVAGYFRSITLSRGDSYAGYYDSLGNYQESGTCSSSSCTYYEYIQYYDDQGNEELASEDEVYYQLVTRDTNIITMTTDLSTTWSSSQDKPFTLTSYYDDDYRDSVVWTVATARNFWGYVSYSGVSVNAYADMVIENLAISCGTSFSSTETASSGTSDAGVFYGRFFNVKLGRGIVQDGSNGNFRGVIGGSNGSSGSSSNVTKYRLMVESGFYNNMAIGNGATGTSQTIYMEGEAIYGNDYDRASDNNNKLDLYYCASGSWGGNYYASTNTGISFDLTVKSGSFGTSKDDYTTGIYVGGRQGGTHYTSRKIIVEGGYIYNLIGGPLTASNRSAINDTYMYIKGGSIDMITGGAGLSATYGNRIIQITDGQVNYSVFGGSNGYEGGSGDGTINGSSFVYVGGNSIIGSSENVLNSNELYGAEAGSVFGIGNGNSNYASIGSNDNSNIIIDGNALIRKNVYGGGNFSAVGVSSDSSETSTFIKINNGKINGSVYGGGNKNGSGDTSKSSTIDIEMYGGEVEGSVYGGSNEKGVIYGNVNVDVIGGTSSNVFGGGRGGYLSSDYPGTFVTKNVNVTIGDSSSSLTPEITGEVFGGSAYGTVNGSENDSTISSDNTTVVVNKGKIGSVYGGGKGDDDYTPYVKGNVTVTINGGTISNVFGGNDASGTPNGGVKVYLKGGSITNTYGGGNRTSVPITNVYLQGATAENIFGGSNMSGDVTTSNVISSSGLANSIYGGNNEGGVTTTSNVTINGAEIIEVYGGGNLAKTDVTNVKINEGVITNCFGGGKSADIETSTKVDLDGGTITSVYGGSNSSGSVPISTINFNDGKVTSIYGGNNEGGFVTTTNVNLNGSSAKNVYGGGNRASSGTSNIVLDGSSVTNVFGGGNAAGLTTSNINLKSGSITNVFGGSNEEGDVSQSNIITSETTNTSGAVNNDLKIKVTPEVVAVDPYWQDTNYTSVATLNIDITNNTDKTIDNWTVSLKDTDSVLYSNYSNHEISSSNGVYTFNQVNRYSSNTPAKIEPGQTYSLNFQIYSKKEVSGYELDEISIIGTDVDGDSFVQNGNNLVVSNLYGGNNRGGTTDSTNINLNRGYTHNIYGGGNLAPVNETSVNCENITVGGQLYGGGNQAAVNNSTSLILKGTNVSGSIFGGGNAGTVGDSTDVYISSSTIEESVYAGGNGASAVVYGNTVLTIDGVSNIEKHVFGGGNAAPTGTESDNNSSSLVNIAGATIGKNVYGGANTSVVYGKTKLNIGIDTISNSDSLIKGNIYIKGTVFGGGEANASGSENYDFSFISVTEGIDIKIDGNNHDSFDIDGSIFGSGNASSTTGYSYIDINNYGSPSDIKTNVSIQRASRVTISNSHMHLQGATDRTNEYADELFSISRVDLLKLKNNSVMYLKTGANLLKKYVSAVDIGDNEVPATVIIDDDTKTVTKNVDNRIYMLEGKVLNIATNENITAYGDVDGMSFFGMYQYSRDGDIETAMYSGDYDYGSSITSNELYYFTGGSYVLGSHKTNHDITVDGFYSNYENEETQGEVQVKYIEPTPENSNFYMWTIGEETSTYTIDDLQASKYLTLGTEELSLVRHAKPNTTFTVVGFNYNGLNSDINLISEEDVPRIAASGDDADKNMSLVMKSTNSGWTNNGSTTFMSSEDTPFSGTTDYKSENSTTTVPSFQFYLYHSKNLATSGDMGQVIITLVAITPVDDLTSDVERINIVVNLSRKLYNTNDYEASITSGKQYDLFATKDVDITTDGSFSTYYSLYAEDATDFYKTGYHRSLVSDFVLPEKTKITMIDYKDHDAPDYYYYVVSSEDYQNSLVKFSAESEVSYDFSKFIRMGSTSSNNNYSDSSNNARYYDESTNSVHEEFIFIVDFGESGIAEDVTDKTLLIELRDQNDQTRVSVLGFEQSLMKYNLHYNKKATIDVTGELEKTNIYPGDIVNLSVETNFIQNTVNGKLVNDTNYYDNQLGIKITLLNDENKQVSGSSLLGFSYELDGEIYYPRIDGSVRINIAEKVSNVASRIKIHTTDSLGPGNYTMKIESFGSPDGIYYGLVSSDSVTIAFTVLDTLYGLKVNIDDKLVVIDSKTGYTLNKNNTLIFKYNYSSVLNNPNIRVSLYRRDYSSIYSTNYELVNLKDYVTNDYQVTDNENEYLLSSSPVDNTEIFMYLKENLKTGTYKMTFSLYDSNSFIGKVEQNLIIK
ncbi:MAG: beta strand repeat-containing protein [Bacilli bacterium]